MADKLSLYNLALGHLGERRLGSLSENREPRRVLDDFWDQTKNECLEEALWNFMIRAIQMDASTTVVPRFGWQYAFEIPTDWMRTVMLSAEETFTAPLLEYMEESGYWYSNCTPLYVRFVSSDRAYGGDLGTWSANFGAYLAFQLAVYSCKRITGSDTALEGANGLSARLRKAKTKAKSNDAMNQPPGRIPLSSWVRSRTGAFQGSRGPNGVGFDD